MLFKKIFNNSITLTIWVKGPQGGQEDQNFVFVYKKKMKTKLCERYSAFVDKTMPV